MRLFHIFVNLKEGQLGTFFYSGTVESSQFFEYPCYIHAELPRTNCGKCNSITRVNVPWALDKPKHYFTLHFDALIIKLAKGMPMNAVSRLLGEHDTRLWRNFIMTWIMRSWSRTCPTSLK
ncbi:hypothetical protein L3476_06290 [Paenibacillus thiaminolyticus]|uniref:helix-turn-helix domain-containing protein n=1 Tax=Paenibacillus thiaminolyticus TaxID=49283 RepID=UPI002350D5DB|nr:helix-turn-helix domain-containing protein [Paenibacillus thiaminolyticus]WCR28350.1 hypothetical protein L3476_06290 [Paenibacillus thiaminolyticus]